MGDEDENAIGVRCEMPPLSQASRKHVDDALALVLFLLNDDANVTLAFSTAVYTNIYRILIPATVHIAYTISTTRALLTCTSSSCTFIFSLPA
jgi:hypothetical protein